MQVRNNYPLSEYLWYKIGGRAKYFVEVTSLADVPLALDFLERQQPERIFVCGLGSNLIFSDEDFDGAVLSIAKPNEKTPLRITDKGLLQVFAGDTLDTAIEFSLDHHLTGLEWAGGLPGTVGAGVRGNVGAFGGEIKDTLATAEVAKLHRKGFSPQTLDKKDLSFSYRHSVLKDNPDLLVLSATFVLTPSHNEAVARARATYQKNIDYRTRNHPLEYPNCGSVFKNIKAKDQVEKVLNVWPEIRDQVEEKWYGKVSMGYIIRRLGFEGYRVGKAEVSKKHCNFIVNLGGAKAVDVRSIIAEIKNRCEETFGFRPEVEVEIVT